MDTRVQKEIDLKQKKQPKKDSVKLIKVKYGIEILESEMFKKALKSKADALKNEINVSPGDGLKWARCPLIRLNEMGYLDDLEKLVSEYLLCFKKESNLSAELRREICSICDYAYFEVKPKFKIEIV